MRKYIGIAYNEEQKKKKKKEKKKTKQKKNNTPAVIFERSSLKRFISECFKNKQFKTIHSLF